MTRCAFTIPRNLTILNLGILCKMTPSYQNKRNRIAFDVTMHEVVAGFNWI